MNRSRTLRPQSAPRQGATLSELAIAVSISGLIVAGLHASLAVSLKSVPNAQGLAGSALSANRAVDQLATELETALHVMERSATTIAFTLPDRDGDGRPERVRYAWDGVPGSSLTRQFNGGTPLAVCGGVQSLLLTPAFKTVTQPFPGLCVEDAAETLLINLNGSTGMQEVNLANGAWLGQYTALELPSGAYAWRPTRVELRAKASDLSGRASVQLRRADANLLPSSTLATAGLNASALSTNFAWASIVFSNVELLPNRAGLCLALQGTAGNPAMILRSATDFPGLLASGDGTAWSYDGGNSLVTRIYGRLHRSSSTVNAASKYLTSVAIALRTNENAAPLSTTAACLNHPELLAGRWELDFKQAPTAADVNGDGQTDWTVENPSTFSPSSIVNGVWRTNGTVLRSQPGNDFAGMTVVDLKFKSTSAGSAAAFSMNALRSGSVCAPVEAVLRRETDGTQTLELRTRTSGDVGKPLLTVPGLPALMTYVRLMIDPAAGTVSLAINDVPYGTYALTRFASSDASRSATISSTGGQAEFAYVRLRILEN